MMGGEKGTFLFSLARKGSAKYTTSIHLLLGDEHIALIEGHYRRLTRSSPTPPGHYLCSIFLNIMSESVKKKRKYMSVSVLVLRH